ncbi:hypothetical protein FKM82_000603 [Ascaphus truei]
MFTEEELEILTNGLVDHHYKLLGSVCSHTSTTEKQLIWGRNLTRINALEKTMRSVDMFKKQWEDSKCKVNNKQADHAAQARKTGGTSCSPSSHPNR